MAERTIIIETVFKSFAMTGWRLGYAVAPKSTSVGAMDLLVLNTFTCAANSRKWQRRGAARFNACR
jgi:aspartate/methionine/tyrosine aminotransferase